MLYKNLVPSSEPNTDGVDAVQVVVMNVKQQEATSPKRRGRPDPAVCAQVMCLSTNISRVSNQNGVTRLYNYHCRDKQFWSETLDFLSLENYNTQMNTFLSQVLEIPLGYKMLQQITSATVTMFTRLVLVIEVCN